MFSRLTVIIGQGSGAAAVAIPLIAQSGSASGPIARYDMRAGTIASMGAMGTGGGGC